MPNQGTGSEPDPSTPGEVQPANPGTPLPRSDGRTNFLSRRLSNALRASSRTTIIDPKFSRNSRRYFVQGGLATLAMLVLLLFSTRYLKLLWLRAWDPASSLCL